MTDAESADRWAIQDLKHRYARGIDVRDWDAVAATLAPEMAAEYRVDLVTEGADALVAELQQRLTEHRITAHQLLHPSIEIDGDTARASWTMADRTICTDIGLLVEGASLSHDEYRRDPERGWLITRITYQRVHETRMKLADVPSFQLVTTPYDALARR